MKVLIAVPMRSISNRLARKLFKAETGKPLALHTLEAAVGTAKAIDGVAYGVADGKLFDFLKRYTHHLARHNGDFENGTQRIFSWLKNFPNGMKSYDCVVNWQADEPLLAAMDVAAAAEHAVKNSRITTLGMDGMTAKEAIDPDIVKAICEPATGRCHYFTRAQEPPIAPLRRLAHIGVYAFPRCCFELAAADATKEAKRTGLEQLIWLEGGGKIDVLEATHTRKMYGGHYKVDSIADYRRFVAKFKSLA